MSDRPGRLSARRKLYRKRTRNTNFQASGSSSEDDAGTMSRPTRKKETHDSGDSTEPGSFSENQQESTDTSAVSDAIDTGEDNSDVNQEPDIILNYNNGAEGENNGLPQNDFNDIDNDLMNLQDNAQLLFNDQLAENAQDEEDDMDAGIEERIQHPPVWRDVMVQPDVRSSDNDSDGNQGSEQSEQSEMSEESEPEDPQESDEDEDVNPHDNEPLYEGAGITLRESSLAILSFVLCHNLSKKSTADLLSLINLHCGPNNHCHKSGHYFKKYFEMLGKDHIVRHYYCSVCELPLASKIAVCRNCQGRHKLAYFIECPIVPQLQGMFSRPGFFESLRFRFTRNKKNPTNIEDIYDGRMYKWLFDIGFLSDPNNISFGMYVDGVARFKSSRFSFWVLFLTINELKYKERTQKQNVILAGLWFGKSKPNANLFLQPLHDQMTIFRTEGIDFELPDRAVVRVKAVVLSAVGDLPAKALFMRMIQYNGLHSCMNCMSPGGRFDLGKTTLQVFPYTRNLQPRTMEEMHTFGDLAIVARQTDPKACVYGVKGPALLAGLLPDMVKCMGIDDMHSVYLGLMKTLLELWFSSEYSHCPFSISIYVDVVDARLMQIKPPFIWQRVPRSIKKELALLKARDLKIFFIFFSVIVLYGILPDRYWEHHCKIVASVSMLNQDSISPDEILIADELVHKYLQDFEELYGLRFLGLNVHQQLHKPDVVRNLGPAWVYACFFYESLNGELSKIVHGTRHVALQISASFSALMRLPFLVNEMDNGVAKSLCQKFMEGGKRRVKIVEVIDNETSVVGKYKSCNPVPDYIRDLLRDNFGILNGRVSYFLRLKKKANVYCSEAYQRSEKKLSCFVEVYKDNVHFLCKVKAFIKWSSCNQNCEQLCMNCNKRFICIVSLYDRVPWRLQELGNLPISHLNKVTPTNTLAAFSVDFIRTACLYIPVDQNEYMCVPNNSLEIE